MEVVCEEHGGMWTATVIIHGLDGTSVKLCSATFSTRSVAEMEARRQAHSSLSQLMRKVWQERWNEGRGG